MLTIGNHTVSPGESKEISLFIARQTDFSDVTLGVKVIRGKAKGPVLSVSAAVHGDELNGVEIIRRLLLHPSLKKLKGTLILVPVVNVFGFNRQSRTLPDNRDLNRTFPGNESGSSASRLAHIYTEQILCNSDVSIDLHTGAVHRYNLPQVRASVGDSTVRDLALAFGAPIVLDSKLREGSIRATATNIGIPVITYEAGEAMRFDSVSIRLGVEGIFNVMAHLGMLDIKPAKKRSRSKPQYIVTESYWVRAECSGLFIGKAKMGSRVKKGQSLGIITDFFARQSEKVIARTDGIVICQHMCPTVNRGDALYHLATFQNDKESLDVIQWINKEWGDELHF